MVSIYESINSRKTSKIMKKYQYEEIIFWLSFITYLISRIANCDIWLQKLLLINVFINMVCAIYYSYKSRKDNDLKD